MEYFVTCLKKVTVNYLVMEDLMAMSEFHAPVDKILFFKKKKNIVLIRGMPLCDDVLFHLYKSCHLTRI